MLESRILPNEGNGGVNYVLKLPEILSSQNSSSAESHQENKFRQLGDGVKQCKNSLDN